MDGITINTQPSPNTDGIDLVGTHCLVQNSTINAGDDNIALGSSSASAVSTDILITNCTFGIGHGVSIGSNTAGGVSNLTVTACTFNGTDYGIRMKSNDAGSGGSGVGGVAQNLAYSNIRMTNIVYGAIVIYSYYGSGGIYGTPTTVTPYGASTQQVDATTVPVWHNITISNVSAVVTGQIAGIIWGRKEVPVTNVVLSHVNISAPSTFDIYNAQGIQFIDSQITVPGTNTFNLYNAEVTVTNSAAHTNLVTLGGLAMPPTNIVLAFFNATAAVTDTNMIGSGTITLGGSMLTFNQDSVSFSNNVSVLSASTLSFTSGTNTYSGALSGSGTLTLNLPGSSALTLSGNSSGFSGAIVVSNTGTLLVNNSTGSGAVAVLSAATLGGNGVIGGPVTVNGTLAPGNAPATLTISNNLVLNGGALLQYQLGSVSDLTVASGDLTLGGTLNVTDSGGFASGTYTLCTYGGALIYNGVSVGTAPAGYNYAIDTNTSGLVSLVVTSLLPLPPQAPSGLTMAEASATQINLSWTNNSSNVDGFKIERSIDGINFTQIAQVLPNTTSYRNTGLMPGTTYYYRVCAYNSGGNSDFSTVASATTPASCPTSVVGWGDDTYGQSTPPAGLTDVVAIATGYYHSLALKSDGTIVGWGWNGYGQATAPEGLTGVVGVAAGWLASLALKSDGTVVGWGGDFFGQATPSAGLSNVVAIAAGWGHGLALRSDGTVVGWGYNSDGQATPPSGLSNVVAIAAGLTHSLALKSDGTVVGWGRNSEGEATPPSWLSEVVSIAAGNMHSLALKNDGTIVGWGYNADGETTVPAGLTEVVAVSAGYNDSLALTSNRAVVGWGGTKCCGPATVPSGLCNVVMIAAGPSHSLAVTCSSVPCAPYGLTATAVSSNQINLGWTDNSNNEDGFKIERVPDSNGNPGTWTQIATVSANVTNYSDVGLTPLTTYWYRVRAFNAGGDSLYSTPASATIPLPPAAPSGLTAATVSAGEIDLNWTDSSNNEDGFNIERAPDNGGVPGSWAQIATVGANVTTYSDTGLSINTKYWYRVRAYNTGGNSDYSNQASATTLPLLPAAPSGLTATTVSSNQINLSWTDNANNEDGFMIERAPDSGGSPGTWAQIATVSANVTNYSDAGLTPLTTYWYRVRAHNAGGNSDYSDPASATTLPLPPQAPSGLTATAVSTNQINLSWTDNSNNEDGFNIERAPDNSGVPGAWTPIAAAGANVTTYSDTGAAANTKYWYRVRAYNTGGNSDYSNQASATTQLLMAPSGRTATAVSTNQVNLTWTDNSSNEDGFEIERAPDNGGSPGTWAQIATVGANVTIYSDTGLSINTKYWYRVRAYNTGGNSNYSNQASATTLPLPPQAPSSLTATTVSSSQINLSWADNSGNEDGFKIERSVDGTNFTQIAQVLPNTTTYRNTGLALGTTYFYRVRAYNRGGSSDFSNVANATTLTSCSSSAVFAWGYYWSTNVPPGLTNVVAISTEYQHNLALKSNGIIVDWASNYYQTNVPASVTNAVAVAAGAFHGLALRSSGTVISWGQNNYGQLNVPASVTNAVAIAAGYSHSLALKSDGTVIGWGYNNYGQANAPPGLIGVVAIAAGYYHNLALKSDGTVVGWGYNNFGQTNVPPGLSNVVAIAAGNSYSLALKGDGTVVGWGDNSYGKRTPPAGLTNVVAIAAGYYHSLGLKSDGTVVGWGQSYNGETNVPPSVAGVTAIGAGYEYSLVLMCGPGVPSALVATTVSASRIDLNWVGNSFGDSFKIERATSASGPWTQVAQVLGNTTTYRNTGLAPGNTYYYRVRAYNAGANSDFSNVANASTPAQCATSVAGWGSNNFGQAAPPTNLTGTVAIAAGGFHSLALKSDGTVVGWGWNNYGQTNVPASVTNAVAIAAGGFHSLALKSDGTVLGWGRNTFGQTNSPAGLTNAVAIAAGYYHSLALKSDGTVFAWGDNSAGQTNLPPGLRGVVAIAAGYRHNLALRSDGTVVGWGYNNAGQTNVPSSVTNAVAIAAGYYNSVALRNNGSITVWGSMPGGPSVTNLVAIAAYTYVMALRSDGTVVGWLGAPTPPAGLTNVVAIAAGSAYNLAMTCAPNAPSALVATPVSVNQINLSWTDNSANENRFGIERLDSSVGLWIEIGSVDPNVTVYSDTTVSCGQSYSYRVRAYNAVAGSPYSAPAFIDPSTVDTDGDGLPDCWMLQYFGHPTGQASDLSRAQDDADGDGLSNLQEYLAGTDPTNSASALQITGITQAGDDILVAWTMGTGTTNALQATAGDADGGFETNDFTDIFAVTNALDTTTNYLDVGAATNSPSRFYRVRLVP
ncbi:MAG: fibronectin type III domain-containing protein [Verrucomicrobiia bacterium]